MALDRNRRAGLLLGMAQGEQVISITSWINPDCTIGRLQFGDFRCFTLELPWVDNTRTISCIPAGTYPAELYESPKHGLVILLKNVPGRDMIEIHAGNFTHQIEGCVLVGDSVKYLDGDLIPDVTNSKRTLLNLLAKLPDHFDVRISRAA